MSLADKYFKEEAQRLLNEGFSDENYEVRPKWPDGTPAHTIKITSVYRDYDLSKEFPILTIRKQAFQGVVRELLWVFQKKSNIVNELGKSASIWRAWEDDKGTIGKSYGWQNSVKHKYFYDGKWMELDQVDNILYLLKNHPMDRRMIIDLWNPAELHEMNLPPCCFCYIFGIENGKLNTMLIQRSGDTLSASGSGSWDTIEAALLTHMLAQSTGYKVGHLHHIVFNEHIYDRHIPILKEIIKNPEYQAPTLWINPEKTDFYSFTEDDFKLENYQATKLDKKFEVAI